MVGQPRFLVIGDAALDVTVAPSQPMRRGGDVPAAIRMSGGGQGANVAIRLARRGTGVSLATALADDVAGSLLRAVLAGEGVRLLPLPVERSSTVVVLLDATGERTMLSDRCALSVDGALETALGAVDWIHCSGYPLLDTSSGDALAARLGVRGADVRLSVAGGSIRPEPELVAAFRRRLATARPDLLIVSLDEASALLGLAPAGAAPAGAATAADALRPAAGVVVVTDGARGSAAAGHGLAHVADPERRDVAVVDTTGSGDAYAAALIAELAGGSWPPDEPTLRGAMAAAGELGARVAAVSGAQGRVEGEP